MKSAQTCLAVFADLGTELRSGESFDRSFAGLIKAGTAPQASNIVSVLGEALVRLRGLSFLAGGLSFRLAKQAWLTSPYSFALPTVPEYSGVRVLN